MVNRVGTNNALDDVPHNLFDDSLAEDGNQRGVLHLSESTHQSSPAVSEIGSRAPRSARMRNPPTTRRLRLARSRKRRPIWERCGP